MLINCCNHYHKARQFDLPCKNKVWRKFVFLDECWICHKPIAEIRELNKQGKTICQHRWKGQKAVDKFNEYLKQSIKINNKLKAAAKGRMNWFYINGTNNIYNFNNDKIGKFDTQITTSKLF